MMVSLDGMIEGADKDLEWHVWDEEMDQYMITFLKQIDVMLFGRVTYQLLESYWPTTTVDHPVLIEQMNHLPKIVFSKTLDKAEWTNTRLLKDNIASEIQQLKQQPGKDMVIFGGADLASTFIKLGLIDEYHLIVNPVVLGKGKPLFQNLQERVPLKFLHQRSFRCGNIALTYQAYGG